MFEIDKSRKHFVPRLYLKGFCPDRKSGQIHVFDKENPESGVALRSIDNVEVSRDAYSVANDALLWERECQWAGILEALKSQPVSELNHLIADRDRSAALRAWLARLVVDSKLRSRGFRQQLRNLSDNMRLLLSQELQTIEASFRARCPDSDEPWEVAFPLLREMSGLDSDRKFEAILIDPFLRGEKGEGWYRTYEEGSWRFDKPPEGRTFITSDIPSDSMVLGPEPEYRNWMCFFMPLSAELRLIGLCGDARMESGFLPRLVDMSEWEMDLANLCVFKNAERFVYSASEDEILRARQQSVA